MSCIPVPGDAGSTLGRREEYRATPALDVVASLDRAKDAARGLDLKEVAQHQGDGLPSGEIVGTLPGAEAGSFKTRLQLADADKLTSAPGHHSAAAPEAAVVGLGECRHSTPRACSPMLQHD